MDPGPGELIGGRYRIDGLLAEGGMGAVVSAHDEQLARRVAVKIMLASEDSASASRFLREARAIASLKSEHIIEILDYGQLDDGRPYMVMELLEGQTVEQLIRARGALGVEEAVELLLQACAGLAVAHAQGIVHRDVKTSNLFVAQRDDGTPLLKVLDFGIAKAPVTARRADEGDTLTATETMLGSPRYMSPEQLRDARRVDARTDIWALGLVLHRMLTGRHAFDAETVGEYFAMIVSASPTALREHDPTLPEGLEALVRRCLRRRANQRPHSTSEIAHALLPWAPARAQSYAERIDAILGPEARQSREAAGDADTSDDTAATESADWGPGERSPAASAARSSARRWPSVALVAIALAGTAALALVWGPGAAREETNGRGAERAAATSATPVVVAQPAAPSTGASRATTAEPRRAPPSARVLPSARVAHAHIDVPRTAAPSTTAAAPSATATASARRVLVGPLEGDL